MANNKKEDQASEEPQAEDVSKSVLGETVKKVFSAGVAAAFMTEESIRSYLAEVKLPKEILNVLLQQANKSKEDLLNKVAGEVQQMLKKIDVVSELSKFAENHKFKISAEVEVIKKNKENE